MSKNTLKKSLTIFMALCVTISVFTVSSFTAYAKKCEKCNGRGFVRCNFCSGSGQFYEYDVMKDGFTWNKCIKCKGSGYRQCPDCHGSGNKAGSSSSASSSSNKPNSTSISKLTAKKNGFSVTWKKKTKKVVGYQVQYSTDKNFKKNKFNRTASGKSKTSLSVSGLKGNKTYYVRVRTYSSVKGKKYYSSWSKKKSVVTLPVAKPKATALTAIKPRDFGFYATWNKQTKNNSGYQVQYSTDKNFKKNVSIKTVKGKNKTSVMVSGLKSKKKYYVRVRSFRSANGKKYYSKWSGKKSIVTNANPYSPSKTPETTLLKPTYLRNIQPFRVYIDFKHIKNCTGYQLQTSLYNDFRADSSTKIYTCPYNNGDLANHVDEYENEGWYWNLNDDGSGYYYLNNENTNIFNRHVSYYYFRMRTYSVINGKTYYGKWSATKRPIEN